MSKIESYQVRQLREFGERLAKDGYPIAIIDQACDRMTQLEELVIHNDQQMQDTGRHILDVEHRIEELRKMKLFRRQAE